MSSLQKASCQKCSLFLTCRDKLKGPRHRCESFVQLKEVGSILELGDLLLSPEKPKPLLAGDSLKVKMEKGHAITELDLSEIDSDPTLPGDFVWDAMQKAFDPLTNSVRDLKIDDSDLQMADNYYHFCTNIAGKAIKTPFSRQLWIASHLLGEYCPRCTPKKYMSINSVPVDMDSKDLAKKMVLMKHGRCPSCGASKAEMVLAKELPDYNQLVMVAGQRGGKSAFTATLNGYHTHLLLKAPRLSTLCRGIQDFTPLTGTFVALTTGRAIKLLWNPFHTMVESSEWFQSYFEMLDLNGRKYGKEFYKKRDLFIRFFHKNLDYYAMGPMKRTLRGDTRIIACYSGKTLVLTTEGWKRIENDLTGYHVDLNGRSHRIVRWFENGVQTTYRLQAQNGLFVDATAEHKFRVFDVATQSFLKKKLKEIQPGDLLVAGLGNQYDNNQPKPLITDGRADERGPFFERIYAFLCSKFEENVEFTNVDLEECTGASQAIITAMNTRLRRLGVIYRSGGKTDGAIRLKVLRKPTSIAELRKSPSGPHTRKWDQPLPTHTSVELASIVGYLLADGDLVGNMKLDSFSSEKIDHFAHCWQVVFGFDPRIHDGRYDNAESRPNSRLYFGGKSVAKFFTDNGFPMGFRQGPDSHTKAVPDFILGGTRAEQLACLSAYLSCNGTVGDKAFSFYSVSKRLTAGMQLLWIGLGYPAYSRTSDSGNGCRLFHADAEAFQTEYLGLDKRTYRKNKQVKTPEAVKNASKAWRIPQMYTPPLYANLEGDLCRNHPLSSGHFTLTEVVSITEKGKEPTFDITVDSPEHMLIANGIVSSNSTDELGWFPYKDTMVDTDDDGDAIEDGTDDEREMANGDEVHQSLDNSLSTIRTEVWQLYKSGVSTIPTGLNLNISSPQSWKDKICRLLKESKDPTALSLGVHLPTWEINPLYTRDHPIIMSAYAKNERRAERDFGANPPRLSENMFRKNILQESFTGKQHHAIVYDEDDPEKTVGKVIDLYVRNKWPPGTMGLDAGLTNNSFAIAIGSRTDSSVEAHSVIELIPKSGKPIFFPRLYSQVILPIIKSCNIVYVGADRWNSVNLLQQVEEDTKGRTKWLHLTLQAHHFSQFKDLVNSGNLTLPELSWDFERIEEVRNYKVELRNKPIEHLYLQFVTVQMRNDNVVKGEGFTDDLFRALVMMATMHFIPKIRKYVLENVVQEREGLSSRATTIVSGRSQAWLNGMR